MDGTCGDENTPSTSYGLTMFIGTPLSLISSLENLFLLCCFLQKRNRQVFTSYLLFFALLAFCDAFISLSYVPIITVDLLRNTLCNDWLTRAWGAYFGPLLAATQTSMVTSTYLILGATFERLLTIWKSRLRQRAQRWRLRIALMAFLLSLATYATSVGDLQIVRVSNVGLPLVYAVYPQWYGHFYDVVYRFWFRSFVSVFLPFLLLTAFNTAIFYKVRNQAAHARIFRFSTTDHKVMIRSVSLSLLVTVLAYLLCHTLKFAITTWEFVDQASLEQQFFDLYMVSTDLISLLTLLNCASHLPIYLAFDRNIRHAIGRTLFGPKSFDKFALSVAAGAPRCPLLHKTRRNAIDTDTLQLQTVAMRLQRSPTRDDTMLNGHNGYTQVTVTPACSTNSRQSQDSNKSKSKNETNSKDNSPSPNHRSMSLWTGTECDVLTTFLATGIRTQSYQIQLERNSLAEIVRTGMEVVKLPTGMQNGDGMTDQTALQRHRSLPQSAYAGQRKTNPNGDTGTFRKYGEILEFVAHI